LGIFYNLFIGASGTLFFFFFTQFIFYLFKNMVFCVHLKKTIQRKLVVVGDGACGKTSLLNVFTRGYFPQVQQ
jgi:ABC-type taurine transport system ATPase subunit